MQSIKASVESNSDDLKPLHYDDRLDNIQNEIHDTYVDLAVRDCKWGRHDGDIESYRLCQLNEFLLLKNIILQAKDRKEFYVMDIGAGQYGFIDAIVTFLNNDADLPKDIKVHVIGLNAEKNSTEKIYQDGICKVYKLGNIKIENLAYALPVKLKNLYLDKVVDLILLRYTLRHLVDPVGTFIQIYNLLRPKTGFLLMDSFYYQLNNVGSSADAKDLMVWLLLQTKAPFLFYEFPELDQFILRRPDNNPCQLPLKYSGLDKDSTGYRQASLEMNSNCITIFEKTNSCIELLPTNINKDKKYYDAKYYRGSAELYEFLKLNRLFTRDQCFENTGGFAKLLGPIGYRYFYAGDFTVVNKELEQNPIMQLNILENIPEIKDTPDFSTAKNIITNYGNKEDYFTFFNNTPSEHKEALSVSKVTENQLDELKGPEVKKI